MENIIWSTGHKRRLDNIVKAENCYLYDTEGNRYLDLESGVWCTSIGHCHPEVNRVIKKQIDEISHSGFAYSHPVIEKAAKNILGIAGLSGGKCEFLCSGSEAVEYGLRVAKTITDKPLILTFDDSYFGAYGDASNKNSDNKFVYDWLECTCNSHEGCTGDCEAFQNIPFNQIGIFLFEPGSSSGLVRFPSQKLIDKIAERIRQNNGFIVANEITTGIGRTGKWFGFQHYNIEADIVAMGKGLGNGYPVSAVAISKKVAGRLNEKPFLYSQSHQNDPLGAAVANELITIIRNENLLDRCNRMGENLKDQLNKLKETYPEIKEIRGRGLMIGIELTEKGAFVVEELFKRKILLVKRSNAEVLRMDPALTIEEKDLDRFVLELEDIFK